MLKRLKTVGCGFFICLFAFSSASGQVLHSLSKNESSRGEETGSGMNATVSSQTGSNPSCSGNCTPPNSSPGVKRIIIDARTGNTQGDLKYKKSDRVEIILINRNPFLYEYAIKVEASTVAEPALAAFLPLLGSFVGDFAAPPKPSDPAKTEKIQPTEDTTCSDARRAEIDALYASTNSDMNSALNVISSLESALRELRARHKVVKDKYEEVREVLYNSPFATCDTLCSKARELLAALRGAVKPDELTRLQDEIDRLRRLGQGIKDRTKYIRDRFADCPLDERFLSGATVFGDGLITRADAYQKIIATIKDDLSAFDKAKTAIDQVLSNPNAFVQVRSLDEFRFERTSDVKVEVSRKRIANADATAAKDQKDEKFKELSLRFGEGPFFSLSGGIVFARLVNRQFQRVQGIQLDENGKQVIVDGVPVLTTVVGLKEETRTRITPLVMLNGRMRRFDGFFDGVHASLGVTAKNDNKGADVEFLVGPSLSMMDEQLFLTVGGYAGRKQQLEGGLFLGALVPSGTAELPIHKEYRWTVGISITYRIK